MCCKKYLAVLFDLDGTLTDPGEGITNSVAYALNYYGIKVENKKDLECFVGPPLFACFEKYYGFSRQKAEAAVEKYREYFSVKGIFENEIFEDTENLLKDLKEQGIKVILATSKPEIYAEKILKHFNIDRYFDCVTGSLLSGERIDKAEVIKEALKRAGDLDAKDCIMVGDKSHDIIGAKKNGMKAVGVLFGYGSLEELQSAQPDYIVENFSELKKVLLKGETL